MEIYQEIHPFEHGKEYRVRRNYTKAAGSMTGTHWHEIAEILYIRRGRAKQRINAAHYDVEPGDVVFLLPEDVHTTDALSADGCDIDVVQIGREMLEKNGGGALLASHIAALKGERAQFLFDALLRYEEEAGPGQQQIMEGLLQLLIGAWIRSDGHRNSRCSPLVLEICAYLEGTEDFRLQETANRFGYCPEHLSRRFREETGMPYRLFCDQIRMRRAAALLHERSLPEVAEKLGYSNESSFIRAFHRLYGITPHAYRKLCLPIPKA